MPNSLHYSRSLLSEQIHKYILNESKYILKPHFILSFTLSNKNRMLVDIWTSKRYAQAFLKFESRGMKDFCIKSSYLHYPHQILEFINKIDRVVEEMNHVYTWLNQEITFPSDDSLWD
jgi:hypothetical protein